jgi:hypothetical protein
MQEPAGVTRRREGSTTKARVGGAMRGDVTTSRRDDRMRGWHNKRMTRGYAKNQLQAIQLLGSGNILEEEFPL